MSSEKDKRLVAVVSSAERYDDMVIQVPGHQGHTVEVGWVTTEDAYVVHYYCTQDGRTVITKDGFEKFIKAYRNAQAVEHEADAVRVLLANIFPCVEFEEGC